MARKHRVKLRNVSPSHFLSCYKEYRLTRLCRIILLEMLRVLRQISHLSRVIGLLLEIERRFRDRMEKSEKKKKIVFSSN